MSNVLIEKQKIDILANAISDKSGVPVTMTLDEMVEAVDGIESNPAPTLQSKTYTVDSAGTSTVTADSGYDGLSEVEVSVPSASIEDSGINWTFSTVNNQRKCTFVPWAGFSGGFISGFTELYGEMRNAVPSNTTITPTESAQTIGDANYMMEGAVTVNAIPSNYVGSGITQRSSSDLTASGATVTVPSGYYSAQASKAVASGTAGTPTATKGTVSNHSISVTPSVTNTAGYISGGTKTGAAVSVSASELVSGTLTISSSGTKDVTNYASASVSSGSATPASTISATGASVSTGTNTLTLSKSVSNTPQVSAGYISSGTAGNSSVSLTATVTTNPTPTASGDTVTIPAGYYSSQTTKSVSSGTAGTPTATKGLVSNHSVTVTPSVTNTTGYITGGTKTGTGVSVSASELVSGSETKTENGTYDVTNLAELVVDVQGGGSSGISIGTATKTLSSSSSSIQFTGLSGNPTSFVVTSSADIATNTNGVTAVVFDGTSLHGQTMTSQVEADTGFTKSYSSGTLTITASTASFQDNAYKLVYTYGGSTSDIETEDVQVGSGATSITFPVNGRPQYWSCIFKSDFSTSSGYQRVIAVANDGSSTYGLDMDSSAHVATAWTASYSGGNLTITSQGTNNGGYFHQPGYYQLTYTVDDSAPSYQTKTVTPTSSQQVIEADSGYDALSKVTVNAIPSEYVVPSGNINITSNTATGQTLNVAQYATATVAVPTGGANIATATMTNSSNQNTSISFTLPSGRTPKAFFARLTSQIARNSSNRYYYVFDMRWDGSSTGGVAGNTFYMYSGTLTDVTSGYSYSQSGTTFTLSSTGSRSASPGSFYNGTYELVYIY